MSQNKETAADDATQEMEMQMIMGGGAARQGQHARPAHSESAEAAAPEITNPADTGWCVQGSPGRGKPSAGRKKDEEDYARKYLTMRKVKEYTPVYIDVRMKEKLQTLITSLQHIVPDITPTVFLSNLIADHIGANRELITRAANEGLKRSLASTFDNEKE